MNLLSQPKLLPRHGLWLLSTCLVLFLSACGGGDADPSAGAVADAGAGDPAETASAQAASAATYSLGGTLSGLASGQQVTLLNNGGNVLTLGANGTFRFSTSTAFNGSYAVTVGIQPTGQVCTVSNGSGSGVKANVSNVSVVCSTPTFSLGGSLSGLASGQQVTLLNNGGNARTLSANGAFSFSTPTVVNGSYSVTVGTQPIGQVCTVNNGSGTGVKANINVVSVVCSSTTFSVGGTIIGLASGQQVTLLNNGGNALTLSANGTFSFTTPTAANGNYAVTVSAQPTGQVCTVNNGSGNGVNANVSTVSVVCSTTTYRVGGTLSGLASGRQITLLNNGGNALALSANGAFSFSTPTAFNGNYAVTVGSQPTGFSFSAPTLFNATNLVTANSQSTGQVCNVKSGSGSGVNANVNNISVSCVTASCTIYQPSTLNAGQTYPVILWGNGTASSPTNYGTLLSHLASKGFIVAAADTPAAGNGKHMLACLDLLTTENANSSSVYFQKVDLAHVGATGHSQGGAGAIMAGTDSRVTATAPIQPFIDPIPWYLSSTPFDSNAKGKQTGPMFLLSGGADTLATPNGHQLPVYNEVNTPVVWWTLKAANHQTPMGDGGGFRVPLTAWFLYRLKNDAVAAQQFPPLCNDCQDKTVWTVRSR